MPHEQLSDASYYIDTAGTALTQATGFPHIVSEFVDQTNGELNIEEAGALGTDDCTLLAKKQLLWGIQKKPSQ